MITSLSFVASEPQHDRVLEATMPDQPPLPACAVLPQYDPTAATSPIVNQVIDSLKKVPLVQADNTLGHFVDNTWSN